MQLFFVKKILKESTYSTLFTIEEKAKSAKELPKQIKFRNMKILFCHIFNSDKFRYFFSSVKIAVITNKKFSLFSHGYRVSKEKPTLFY